MLVVVGSAGACVGEDPGSNAAPPIQAPDGSAPCTGPGCDGGGPDPIETDSGADAGPPPCSKIQVTTLAGSVEGSMNGPGNIATFDRPEGITVDPATGTLFVADTGNKNVRKVLADGTTSTLSTTAQGGWHTPRHAFFRPGFNDVLVTDFGNDQVFRVASDGTATSDFALGAMMATTVQPTTLDRFCVSGTRVAKWIPGGGVIEATAFSGDFQSGYVDGNGTMARYGWLVDLAFDGQSDLYVADQGNHRIRKVNAAIGANYGDVVTVAGSSTPGHRDGTGDAVQFEGPNGIVIDPTTHLIYIADGATIRVMTPAGEVSTLVGSTSAYVDGDGCTAKFINAKGITKFANELYVLDVNRIRKIVMN